MINKRDKVKIVTHTGCDISFDEAEKLSIEMIADLIILENVSYRNMVDVSPQDFYRKLRTLSQLPTSSHPSTGDYLNAYLKASEESDNILCLMITSKMSGCYNTAVTAGKLFETRGLSSKVSVYDTGQCSHGMGIMVRHAAKLADEGCTVDEIISRLDEIKNKIGVYFILESLKYAKKGGRVGAIKMLAADFLV